MGYSDVRFGGREMGEGVVMAVFVGLALGWILFDDVTD